VKRETKETRVSELIDLFKENNSFYLLDFKNMTVSQSVDLRKTLRRNSYSFKVVKNRLAIRSLPDELPESLKQYFRQPTGVAFASHDPVSLARILKDFSTQNKVLAVKGGVFEGRFFAPERFEEIATLSSREELLAKIGSSMTFPLMKLLRTWQAPLVNLGRMLSQLKSKK